MSYSLETLKQFKSWGVGLIDPTGTLIPVQTFGHFNELKEHPEFESDILEFEQRVDDWQEEFYKSCPADEHIEWHVFELWRDQEQDDLRQQILKKAYDLGWGRIGFLSKSSDDNLVELETSRKNLNRLKTYGSQIAEMLDAELSVIDVDKFED